jgi:hypothetical protein
VLHGNAAGLPSYSAVSLATDITGTLGVGSGGTNLTSYTTGDLLYASGAASLSRLSDVGAGSVLVSGGVGVAPGYSATPSLTSLTLSNGLNVTGGGATITGSLSSTGNGTFGGVNVGSVGNGFYGDSTNLAARFPGAGGGLYVQNNGGSTSYAIIGPASGYSSAQFYGDVGVTGNLNVGGAITAGRTVVTTSVTLPATLTCPWGGTCYYNTTFSGATCPAGTNVVGGGCNFYMFGCQLLITEPFGNGWACQGYCSGNNGGGNALDIVSICARIQ